MFTAVHALSTQLDPGSKAFWALLPVFVLVLALICYALFDLVRTPRVRYLPKWLWALIIIFGSAPLGALAYFVLGRTHHDINPEDQSDLDDANADSAGDIRADVGAGRVLTDRPRSSHEREIRL